MKTAACTLDARETEKIVLSRFNEADPRQHQMKLLFGFGMYAAFRGIREHVNLSPSHIVQGQFPLQHPVPELAGKPFIAVTCVLDEKTNKLSVNNVYVRDTSNQFRIPVDWSDPENFGACVLRFLQKCSPGQDRMYCKVASFPHKQRLIADGYPDAEFFAKRPLGLNMVRVLFKEGAKILGLPEDFRPHSLRGACITKLVNAPDVSLAETMSHARHNSVSASKNYQRIDGISEGNRFRALGLIPAQAHSTAKEEAVASGKTSSPIVDFPSSSSPTSSSFFIPTGKTEYVDPQAEEKLEADDKFSVNDVEITYLQRQIDDLQDSIERRKAATASAVRANPVFDGGIGKKEKCPVKSTESSSDSDSDDNLLLVDLNIAQRKRIRSLTKSMAEKEEQIEQLEAQNKELFRIYGGSYGMHFYERMQEEKKVQAKKRKKDRKGKRAVGKK